MYFKESSVHISYECYEFTAYLLAAKMAFKKTS